jgi:hypothetical protein
VGEGGKPLRKAERYDQYMARVKESQEWHKKSFGKRVRKDANVVADMVFARSTLSPEDEKNFDDKKWFHDTVEWVAQKYGKEAVIGGALHRDEPDRLTGKVHPHIHVMIVPRYEGTGPNDRGRISFEKTFPAYTYSDLQTEYHEKVTKAHGLDRGVKREESHQYVSPSEFKRRSDRQQKKLVAQIAKAFEKHPEKAPELMAKWAEKYAPGLASQEIMEQRTKEQNRKYFSELQDKLATAENRLSFAQNENRRKASEVSELKAENEALKAENGRVGKIAERLTDILAYGNDKTVSEFREVVREEMLSKGVKRPRHLKDSQVEKEFQRPTLNRGFGIGD